MKHIAIIGAGGVTSHLLKPLLMTFPQVRVTLYDGDKLEERNLSRQVFREEDIGKYKVQALIEIHGDRVHGYPFFFDMETLLEEDVDMIISAADSHRARLNVLSYADLEKIPAIIGGNEYFDSEAILYLPMFHEGTEKDPRVRYPEIQKMADEERSVQSCTGEAQVAHPQLALANFSCAAKILHHLYYYQTHCEKNWNERWFREQIINAPNHIRENVYNVEHL